MITIQELIDQLSNFNVNSPIVIKNASSMETYNINNLEFDNESGHVFCCADIDDEDIRDIESYWEEYLENFDELIDWPEDDIYVN